MQAFAAGFLSEDTLMGRLFDDPIDEMNRINAGEIKQISKQKVMKDFQALLEKQAPTISEEILAENEVPLSEEDIGQTLEGRRNERPAGMSIQGTGAPAQPPIQSQPGQTAPAVEVTV